MDDYLRSDAPVIEALDRAWDRSRLSAATRLARLRSRAFLLVQCAVAAGVAWWLAADVLGHVSPFFAPVVAVVCLGMSYGQRQRRVLEVAIGVAVVVSQGGSGSKVAAPAVRGIFDAILALRM